MNILRTILASGLLLVGSSGIAQAESIVDNITGDLLHWQNNEIQFQYGTNYKQAYVPGSPAENQKIITLQHANGWKYGDNFFFIDFIDGDDTGRDIYGEIYTNLSFEKITGATIDVGPLTDIGFIAGFNHAREAKVYKYLPGLRLDWDVPGFAYLHTDITAYIDDSQGVSKGGAPSEDDSFMVDVSWARPFSVGVHDFSIEGHVEYIGSRDNELGGDVEAHILGQPQLRYDLGKALFNKPQTLYAGIEYQFWVNKLGDDKTNENNVQALAVFNF